MNIFDAIEDGLHDDDLDKIITACKTRQKVIPLAVGDMIVVADNCSPKYMQGVKGKIKSKTSKKAKGETVYLVEVLSTEHWKLSGTKMLQFSPSNGGFKCLDINMPRSLITKVNAEVDA